MAFTEAEIESAGATAWTGKATALVYEAPAAVSTWLVRRGLTSFSTSEAADQEVALLRATEDAEDAVKVRFRGTRVTEGQRLLFPAWGAYDGRGRLVPQNSAPVEYLEGIRLLAEYIRAGTYMQLAGSGGGIGIKSERTRNSATEYQDGLDLTSLAVNHPPAWKKLRMAIPGML